MNNNKTQNNKKSTTENYSVILLESSCEVRRILKLIENEL